MLKSSPEIDQPIVLQQYWSGKKGDRFIFRGRKNRSSPLFCTRAHSHFFGRMSATENTEGEEVTDSSTDFNAKRLVDGVKRISL